MNVSKTTLTLAMTVALGAAGSVNAGQSQNPFGMQHLQSGYIQLAEAKAQDGKCGNTTETKASDGKCGNNTPKAEEKVKDGKCAANTPEPKVKDGKCAANKQSDSMDRGTAKATEAKCGEGKCGSKA